MKLYLLNRYYFRPHITFDVEPKPDGAMQIAGLNTDPSEYILTSNVLNWMARFAAAFPVFIDDWSICTCPSHTGWLVLGVCKHISELILRNRIIVLLRVCSLNFQQLLQNCSAKAIHECLPTAAVKILSTQRLQILFYNQICENAMFLSNICHWVFIFAR